jgi:replicative DNA helicase
MKRYVDNHQEFIRKLIREELDKLTKIKYYHGTTLKNFNEVKNVSGLYFTPLYDDAVMYALMGNEANFERKLKNADADIVDMVYENPKQVLIDLFDKTDKPIILIYETIENLTDEYEIMFDDITKKDLKIKYIDFNEYDKISPLWVDLRNYLH